MSRNSGETHEAKQANRKFSHQLVYNYCNILDVPNVAKCLCSSSLVFSGDV